MARYSDVLRSQIKNTQTSTELPQSKDHGDIAVIGMACRFPQAPDLDAFWQLLSEGRDVVTEIPIERWDWRECFDEHPDAAGKHYNRWGGFLDKVDQFDPFFFHVSPKEAILMDPQQRLFLETVWRTLEHAGYAGDALSGQEVGVFAGCTNNHYVTRYQLINEAEDHYIAAIGNWNAVLPNRVSYFLNLQGPSMLVDTLCSSTLVAVHLACDSLRRGECTTAIAGGVNLVLAPDHFIGASKLKAHAPDGRCKAFDHRANGFTSGEGVGAVFLKPLAAALIDGDAVYGVIKGSAFNHDGRTNGLMAPNPQSQTRVIRRALRAANVSAKSISYVECHGTGTALGDPMEIDGLSRAFADDNVEKASCAIGSVKTNIGHLEAAAGAAGLIKLLLALGHRQLPASLHYQRANPLIQFDDTPFYVNTALTPWRAPGVLRAGISSFGLSGVNAHMILEEAPMITTAPVAMSCYLLPISARSQNSLRELINRYRVYLERRSSIDLRDLCWTASTGAGQFAHRVVFIGASRQELIDALGGFSLNKGVSDEKAQRIFSALSTHASSTGDTLVGTNDPWLCAAQSYTAGQPVDWSSLYNTPRARRVPLPPYPFERARYWASLAQPERPPRIDAARPFTRALTHPFLGRPVIFGEGRRT